MELVHAKGPALRAWQDLVMEWQLTTPQWQARPRKAINCAVGPCRLRTRGIRVVGSPVPVQMRER